MAIVLLLAIVLRRTRDVALVIASLLLGIGVAFDIYFVMNWRAGTTNHLQSSTARAVVFSALTTMAAFGSLALSPDPSTAQMGLLLTTSLTVALLCALFVLPALLGPAPPAAVQPAASDRIESVKCINSPGAMLVTVSGKNCRRDAPVALVEPEHWEAGNPPPRARHSIARDARIMAGIRNRPFGERPSPAAREPRR